MSCRAWFRSLPPPPPPVLLELVPFRSFSPSSSNHDIPPSSSSVNFYDVLGVSHRATQREIKSAYYKLSKLYHPDKNKGNELAAYKFRQITEAYETLGNFVLRKRYDKGIRVTGGHSVTTSSETTFADHDDSEYRAFYQSRMTMSKPPPPRGRSSIYNFDEFYNAHYGKVVEREARARAIKEFNAWSEANIKRQDKVNYVIFGVTVLLIIIFFDAFSHPNYDVVKNTDSKGKKSKESGDPKES